MFVGRKERKSLRQRKNGWRLRGPATWLSTAGRDWIFASRWFRLHFPSPCRALLPPAIFMETLPYKEKNWQPYCRMNIYVSEWWLLMISPARLFTALLWVCSCCLFATGANVTLFESPDNRTVANSGLGSLWHAHHKFGISVVAGKLIGFYHQILSSFGHASFTIVLARGTTHLIFRLPSSFQSV